MKKILTAITLCAVLCLTGCGKEKTSSAVNAGNNTTSSTPAGNNAASSTPAGNNSASSTPAENNAASSTPADNNSAASTPAENNSTASTPNSESNAVTRGKWNGNVFTSDFFGFTVTLDQGYEIATNEDLADMNGMADTTDASFIAALESTDANTAVYDLFAMNDIGNIALAYNKFEGMSIDDYVEANANGLKLTDAFKDTKTGTIKANGERQPCIFTTLDNGTSEVYEIMIVYNNGDYFAILTFAAVSEGDLNNMVANAVG